MENNFVRWMSVTNLTMKKKRKEKEIKKKKTVK